MPKSGDVFVHKILAEKSKNKEKRDLGGLDSYKDSYKDCVAELGHIYNSGGALGTSRDLGAKIYNDIHGGRRLVLLNLDHYLVLLNLSSYLGSYTKS